MRVAYLSSRCVLDDGAGSRADRYEHDLQVEPMTRACADAGIELDAVAWDDPAFDPSSCDAAVVGTTWDYVERLDQFLHRLGEIDEATRLINPIEVIRWNADKGYLRDLADRGVAVVPTRWCERADAGAIGRAADELGVRRVVVKPRVGACAWRQAIVDAADTLPDPAQLPPGACLVQPYVESIEDEGEYSMVLLDGSYSHCARKVPRAGDYRIQSIFGGTEHTHQSTADEINRALEAVEAVGADLLYARVDLVRLGDGGLAIMELELIEPYLYPEQGGGFADRFVAGLVRRLKA